MIATDIMTANMSVSLNFFHDFIDFSSDLIDQIEVHLWHQNFQIENA